MGKSLKTSQRTIAAVSIASLALLNVGIMAPAAHAQTEQAQKNVVSMPDEVTLKVTKLTTPESDVRADGEPKTDLPSDSKPIQGVTFTGYKVKDIDLTTNEGWIKANALAEKWKELNQKDNEEALKTALDSKSITVGETTYSWDESNTISGTTGDDGVASMSVSGADRGFYLVKESITGSVTIKGDTDETVDGSSVTQSAPFFVALPMTKQSSTGEGEGNSEWLSEVNVYPKNSVPGVTKEVTDAQSPGTGNQNESSDIVYTIKGDIPTNVKVLENYKLIDPLDSRLKYQEGQDVISLVGAKEGFELTSDDYRIAVVDAKAGTANPAGGKTNGQEEATVGQWITVTFNEKGRKKLLESGASKVKWDLTARVTDISGATDIKNKAFVIPGNEGDNEWNDKPKNPDEPKIPGKPSKVVISKYGKVEITKVKEDGTTVLPGAVFELYRCDADKNFVGGAISVDGESRFKSNDEGKVIIDGLQLNDFKNDKATGVTREEAEAAGLKAGNVWKTNNFYCLDEVKAPAGYELRPESLQFQLLANPSEEDGQDPYMYVASIKNLPKNGGFELPLTGGKGIFGLIALGALLVLGSIGYIFFASRRQES